jgi:hypothetical protein
MQATDAKARLIRLHAERRQALDLGIENPSPYMTRLDAAIAEADWDYTMIAVLEIAVLRRQLAALTRG